MKKFWYKFLILILSLGMMLPIGLNQILSAPKAKAATNVSTNPATGITSSDATLNGVNGPTDASGHSFWVSLSTFSTASPSIPSGVHSTPDLGPISANNSFSALLSSITTSGVPTDLPPIQPNTTYYFAAWSDVSGTWYPGDILTFTTAPLGPVFIDSNANNVMDPGEQTFATIQDAVTAANSGDTIGVEAGTYDQGSNEIDINKSLTIKGPNSAINPNGGSRVAEAIIEGTAGGGPATFNITSSVNVKFEGLEFETSGAEMRSDAIGPNITLNNNIFARAMNDGMYFQNPNLTMNDNLFTFINTPNADTVQLGGGTVTISGNTWSHISSSGALNLSAVSGTISDNTFDGVQYYGVLVAGNSNLNISGNVFNNISNPDHGTSDTWGAGVRFYDDVSSATGATISNNSFSNSYAGISVKPSANISNLIVADHNSFTNNSSANLKNESAGTFTATHNWWGSADLTTVEAGIIGNADFKPYYIDAAMTKLSDIASIDSFSFNSLSPAVAGIINQTTGTIILTVPFGTDVTNLTPTIGFTGSSVNPASGAAEDFSLSRGYAVTSCDGTFTKDYNVTVAITPGPQISNQSASNATSNSVTISWTTLNEASTSRVIYDTVSHPTLGSAPNYGYTFSTAKDSNKVNNHSVLITGLTPGTTYYYRTISSGSPEVIGSEMSFTTSSVKIITTSATAPTASVTTPSTTPTISPSPSASPEIGEIKGTSTPSSSSEKINWTPWIILFILIILAGVATGGYFYWFGKDEEEIESYEVLEKSRKPAAKKSTRGAAKPQAKKPTTRKKQRW